MGNLYLMWAKFCILSKDAGHGQKTRDKKLCVCRCLLRRHGCNIKSFEIIGVISNPFEIIGVISHPFEIIGVISNPFEIICLISNPFETIGVISNPFEIIGVISNPFEIILIIILEHRALR